MDITSDLVDRIARLARLSLSEPERAAARSHFEKVLAYVDSLASLDTEHVDPSVFPRETSNVMADDVPRESLPRELGLENAPAKDDGFFLVPRII